MRRSATDVVRGHLLGNATRGGNAAFSLPTVAVPCERPSYTLLRHHRRGFRSAAAPSAWLSHARGSAASFATSGGCHPSLPVFGASVAWARTAVTAGNPERRHTRSYAMGHEMYSKDLYNILGIKDAASQEEIKTAFYKKAKEYHPDMNKENPNAQKKFVEATSAYEILRDTKKRQEYDGMRRMRSSSSSTYTSYTHQSDYKNYGAGGARAGRTGRADDFTAYGMGGMGHEDFTQWYRQRSDIFDDFEKMFKDEAERMRKAGGGAWEVHSTPFGTVYKYKGTHASGARGANGGSGPDIPFFTGSLFGTALRMFADAMTRGAYPSGAAGSPFEASARAGLKQGPDGLPVFPRRFIAQEAVSLTADSLLQPQRSQRQARLTWDLQEAATGEYLGRLDQHGVDDLGACIKFHNTEGATVAKATRVWTHDAKAAKASDSAAVIKAALERGARGQVISLVGARTNATLAKVVEFAPGDYASPLTRWLNAFYTSFVVLDDRGEESAMVRRYAVPRLFSYYRGVDAHGQRVVECRLPLALVRWKTRWAFERSAAGMSEGESEDEAWRREMRGEAKKKGRLHSLVFPVMAAFHSIDTHQTSLFKRILG